ncbi:MULTISPECIES: type II secretion system protein [Pseudomonas]|uniref:competence type IV pilus major pilin ComGC n=1 Tax=Pseudomonas TaxID=286 RepID=UPI002FCDC4C5
MRRTSGVMKVGQKGFTMVELAVVLLILGILAVLMTPNMAADINTRRSKATIQDTQTILDAARSFRSDTGTWPGSAAGCATGITVLTSGNYLKGVTATNRFNNPVTTSCDATGRTFSVVQEAVQDWDGFLVNSLPGTTITNPGIFQVTSVIGIPGSEPALSAKLSRVYTGNPEDNRMRTTMYMGNQSIVESGNINFSVPNPTLHADSGSLTLSAQNGQIVVPSGQQIIVDDIIVRKRNNRSLADGMPNFVQIGTYIVRDGWLVSMPACGAGGTPKASLRPASMRGGFSAAAGPDLVGRYGINYRLTPSGGVWVVTAVSEGFAADYANLDSLVDVYCYYPG